VITSVILAPSSCSRVAEAYMLLHFVLYDEGLEDIIVKYYYSFREKIVYQIYFLTILGVIDCLGAVYEFMP